MKKIEKNFNRKRYLAKNLKFLYLFFLLILAIFFLNFFNKEIKNFFYNISAPFNKVFWKIGKINSEFWGNIFSKGGFKTNESEKLKEENLKLINQIIYLQNLQSKCEDIQLFNLIPSENKLETLVSEIIGEEMTDEILINRGKKDGIKEGMVVIDRNHILYGKISKVYKNFSKVELLSNKKSIIDIKIIPLDEEESNNGVTKNIYGILKGEGELKVVIDMVPVAEKIEKNYLVVSSGLNKEIPKNLLIGKIKEIKKRDQSPYQQAEVEMFFDIYNIENLFVVTNYLSE